MFYIKKNPVVNANSVDADQTPRSATSDLGLHCLPVTFLRVSKTKMSKLSNVSACVHFASLFYF